MSHVIQVMPNLTADTCDVLYPCGHKITVTGAAMSKLGHGAYPSSCPTCLSTGMTQKWVDQEEAKLWSADPKWGGFPPVRQDPSLEPGAMIAINPGASVSYIPFTPQPEPRLPPNMSTGPLAWLDFQLQSVTRRAFN